MRQPHPCVGASRNLAQLGTEHSTSHDRGRPGAPSHAARPHPTRFGEPAPPGRAGALACLGAGPRRRCSARQLVGPACMHVQCSERPRSTPASSTAPTTSSAAEGRRAPAPGPAPVIANPFVYEINTWVWLDELSRQAGGRVDLAHVPEAEWDRIASLGFDAVWLMGVWERSPAGIAIARATPALLESFARALPDVAPADVVGSPYCIRDYVVDDRLGGPDALAAARAGARPARARADPRLRPEPRRAWTIRGSRRIPSTSSAATRPPSSATRRRSSASASSSSRTAATRTSPRGPTSCSSTRSRPTCAAP